MHEKKFWVDKFNLPVNEVLTKEVAEAWRAIGCPEYIHNNLIIFTK
jgi:hypothetical protein